MTSNGSNGHAIVKTSNGNAPAAISLARSTSASDALYRDFIEVLWRRKWVLVVILLVSTCYSYVLIHQMTPIYTSSTRIYVSQNGQRVLTGVEGLTNTTAANTFLYMQMELIKSNAVLAAALDQAGNRQLPTFVGVSNPVGYLRSLLTIEISKNDDGLMISCNSPNPADAALLANSVVRAFADYSAMKKTSNANGTLADLQRQKDKCDREMNAILDQQLIFKRQFGSSTFDVDKGSFVVPDLTELSAKHTLAKIETIEAQSVYESAYKLKDNPVMLEKLVDSGVGSSTSFMERSEVLTMRQEVRTLEVQLEAAKFRYGDNHSVVLGLKTQRQETLRRLEQLQQRSIQTYLDILKQKWLTAQQAEGSLAKAVDSKQQETIKLNEQAALFMRLEADRKRVEKLSDMLDNRMKEIHITEDVSAPTISVLDEARPASMPSKPEKTRMMAIGIAIGLFLGGGSAFLLDWLDHRIRSVDEFKGMATPVPVMGIVPHASRSGVQQLGQAVHLQPRSSVAESYRTIRMAIHFSSYQRPCHKILITSPLSGDGKTATAANLAIAIAQSGERAVIMDADFHRPKQHTIFGTPNDVGLSNVLLGQAPLEDVVLTTPIPRVDIIPSGPLPQNPYELLNSHEFRDIFEVLKNHYDHVIIDSPALLALADSLVLASVADATVLVARVHRTRRGAFEEAVASLALADARILGVVVTDVRGSKRRYGLYCSEYRTKPRFSFGRLNLPRMSGTQSS